MSDLIKREPSVGFLCSAYSKEALAWFLWKALLELEYIDKRDWEGADCPPDKPRKTRVDWLKFLEEP